MNRPPLNLAVLGTGGIATRAFGPALREAAGARLWSVLSRDLGRAHAFATEFGAAASQAAFADLPALLSDPDLDGVIIATPDALHVEQAVAAARAGKHVLCEKPLANSRDDARIMVAAAADADVRLGVAYHLRWHVGHRAVAAMLDAGELGDIRHMRVQWAWPANDDSNWRAHPELGRWWSLSGVGTHCLDLIRWIMVPRCGEVDRIESVVTRAVWNGPHDETAVVALRFQDGATAELTSSVLFEAPSRVEVYGSTGYAIATGTLGPHGGGRIETSAGRLDFLRRDPFVGEIEDFAAAVREGRDPEVDGREGLRNVELLEQACP